MPSTDRSDSGQDDDSDDKAFRQRLMQVALFDRIDQGVDALDVNRFQATGLLQEVTPPPLPDGLVDILRDRGHPERGPIPDGPLVFVREQQQVSVQEVALLLLRPEREIRCAAIDYLGIAHSSSVAWLTSRTAQLLKTQSSEIQTHGEWHKAAIGAATALRKDYFAHLAGLRQSLATRYQDGIDHYLPKVIRPRFDDLANLRPPLWSPSEQGDEVQTWIGEFSERPTLAGALTEYVNRCGYIPLNGKFGAAAVVERWLDRHPDSEIRWTELWSWAIQCGHPVAKYHAITIALQRPGMFPGESDLPHFWRETSAIVDHNAESWPLEWALFCDASSHFTCHVESLHPGQDDDRVACYGWWLATLFGDAFWHGGHDLKSVLTRIVEPELKFSHRRWQIARSHVVPSPLRHATLQFRSVWTISLLAEIRRSKERLVFDQIPQELRDMIGGILSGYLISSPLGAKHDETKAIFAFQEGCLSNELGNWDRFIPDGEHAAFGEVIAFRNRLSKAEEIQPRLERIVELSDNEKTLTLLFMVDAVSSGHSVDDLLSKWLTQPDRAIDTLLRLEGHQLDLLLTVLSEFHQRSSTQWTVRLPHILARATEQADAKERAMLLIGHIVLMSINSGIVSPMQRVAASRWKSDVLAWIRAWRDGIVEIGRHSEPWVAARCRAASAAISRLIGPRSYDG